MLARSRVAVTLMGQWYVVTVLMMFGLPFMHAKNSTYGLLTGLLMVLS